MPTDKDYTIILEVYDPQNDELTIRTIGETNCGSLIAGDASMTYRSVNLKLVDGTVIKLYLEEDRQLETITGDSSQELRLIFTDTNVGINT